MNKYIMNDSGANIFVVEDHATLKKMLPVIDGPPCMYRIMLVFWHLGWVDTDFESLIIPLSVWVWVWVWVTPPSVCHIYFTTQSQ